MKKGQMTIFVILGILIVAGIFFILYLRGTFTYLGQPSSLAEELAAVNGHVSSCLHDISQQETILLGKQGGYLNVLPGSFRLYNDTKISYLCYNIKDLPTCRNRLLLKEDMEANLEKEIDNQLISCINLKEFVNSQFDVIEVSPWKVDASIGDSSVRVNLDYPLKIVSKKTSDQITNDRYSVSLNYPLGNLFRASSSIIKDETIIGNFDPLPYVLQNPQYKIIKVKPYPDKIYIIKKTDNPFIFQFAIQG